MKRSLVYKVALLLVLSVVHSHFLFAQNNFSYKAMLDTIQQSGFYNITLTPNIVAKCKKDIDDVRIKDDAGKEAPYILYTESARPNEDAFTEFPVSYNNNRSAIIINNILPNSISRLFLLIKNSDAYRFATLSGSDDAEHWFIIKEDIVLQDEYKTNDDVFVQSISFQPSNYKYFQITMPEKNMLPLNIVKAGVYRQGFSSSVYDEIPTPVIIQKDSSDKKSYVYQQFDDSYEIDKLNLSFSGIEYFKRPIFIYDKNTLNSPLSTDTILSGRQASIELSGKTNRLLVVISNGDNIPLTAIKADAFQLHTSVTAYLDAGKKYTLYFGDSSAIAPSYDLQYFDDSIANDIQPLVVKNFERISVASTKKTDDNHSSKWLLWTIIIAVLLLLLYFSYKMITDIQNKTNKDVHL